MTIEPAGQILMSEIRNAVDQLKGCLTPLCDVNDKGEAELLGSAVLIAFAGETFLCTAKHVIDQNQISTLYFDGPSKLEILEGDFQVSAEHDTAVLKLSPAQASAFSKYRPLTENEIGNQAQTAASRYVEFIGYPASKNRKIYQQNKIRGLLQSIGGTVIEITPARVRVSFSKERNIDARTRQRVTAPDPHGMSGGAMFGVAVDSDTIKGAPQPKLIGISTDRPSPKEVFGSTIAIAMAIISDRWQVPLPARLDPLHIKTSASEA